MSTYSKRAKIDKEKSNKRKRLSFTLSENLIFSKMYLKNSVIFQKRYQKQIGSRKPGNLPRKIFK